MKKYLMSLLGIAMVATAHAETDMAAANCMVMVSSAAGTVALMDVDLPGEQKYNFVRAVLTKEARCFDELVEYYVKSCIKGDKEKHINKCYDRAMNFANNLINLHNNMVDAKDAQINVVDSIAHAKDLCAKAFPGDDEYLQYQLADSTHYDVIVNYNGVKSKVDQTKYEAGKYQGFVVGLEYSALYKKNNNSPDYACKITCHRERDFTSIRPKHVCSVLEAGYVPVTTR